MTATLTAPPSGRVTPIPAPSPARAGRRLLKTGATAGIAAAVATPTVAGVARGLGVSLRLSGQAIPLPGFATLTVMGAVIGTVLAIGLVRLASRPRRSFVTTTIALTLLSIVPDLLVNAQVSTKLTLVLTHFVAAAIVVPALATRLPE